VLVAMHWVLVALLSERQHADLHTQCIPHAHKLN
jgi:hypothetical protein